MRTLPMGTLAVALAVSLRAGPAAAWDYTQGGKDWQTGLCTSQAMQSPINLPEAAGEGNRDMLFNYPPLATPTDFYATAHSLAFTIPEDYVGGFGLVTTEVGNRKKQLQTLRKRGAEAFRLWQVEFHSPAEHTFNGQRAPLEVQLSHKRADSNEVAIISTHFEVAEGGANAFLESFISKGLPETPWETKNLEFEGNGLDFINILLATEGVTKGQGLYFNYEGSLTTPPCEPGVQWFVRQAAVGASLQQLTAIADVMRKLSPPRGNSRNTVESFSPVHMFRAAAIDADMKHRIDMPPVTEDQKEGFDAEAIHGNPKFQMLLPGDSPQMMEAKRRYAQAKLDFTSAHNQNTVAGRDLSQVEGMYSKAPGLVGKIDLKWNVIDKTNIAKAAKSDFEQAKKELDIAARHLQEVANKAAGDVAREEDAGDKPHELTTEYIPPEAPTEKPRIDLKYSPQVLLPNGAPGNPFSHPLQHVDTEARVGKGKMARVFSKIANNLKQPVGPDIPQPLFSVGKTTTEAPPVPPPPVQVTVIIPVAEGAVVSEKDEEKLADNVKNSLAKGSGIAPERVTIRGRRIAF